MSEVHLSDLRNGIEKCHWFISSEIEGNDYNISGIWVIENPDKSQKLHVEFDGLDEAGVWPLIKSYGCKIQEHPEISVHFSKKGKSWPDNLNEFLSKLKELNT